MVILHVISSLILLWFATASNQPCRLADANVERAIAAKAATLHGHEYCEFRHYSALEDLDGDGKPDFAVTFNVEGVEGANNIVGVLFVYLSSRGPNAPPLEAPVGRRGTFLPNRISGADHQLIIETDNWRDSDAMCCPSLTGALVFTVAGGKLKRR